MKQHICPYDRGLLRGTHVANVRLHFKKFSILKLKAIEITGKALSHQANYVFTVQKEL